MTTNATRRIEEWFAGMHEDGDFIRVERDDPYQLIGPAADDESFVYCTKTSVAFSAVHENPSGFRAGLISRFGLPREDDAQWLRTLIGEHELKFLGDLDPVDVMIFAWLREQLAPIKVTHRGVNDRFISALGVIVPTAYRIRLGSSELAAVSELKELVPDVEELLGPGCYQVLSDGYKIEMEAVHSALGSPGSLLSRGINYQ